MNLCDKLKGARVEKDVENAYRSEVSGGTAAAWASPFGTDGVADWSPTGAEASSVRLLLEAKYEIDMKSRMPVCGGRDSPAVVRRPR